MIIEKVINNNIVRSKNENQQEVLLVGCGLGFKKQIGDDVENEKIEKIYVNFPERPLNQIEKALANISYECIQVVNKIVEKARNVLNREFPDNTYLGLIDHINFAIERHNKGLIIRNALMWEIKRFYSAEYAIGVEALQIIKEITGVTLPEDEGAFIAVHLVSASLDSFETGRIKESLEIIRNILNLITYHFSIDLDENSLHYERFITHLKFFVQRVFSGIELNDGDEDFLLILKDKYKEEYLCALKVFEYFLKKYQIRLTNDEMAYLTIHIRRITLKR